MEDWISGIKGGNKISIDSIDNLKESLYAEKNMVISRAADSY